MALFQRTYGSGEPLLILHGLLGGSANWHTVAKRLGESYRVRATGSRTRSCQTSPAGRSAVSRP